MNPERHQPPERRETELSSEISRLTEGIFLRREKIVARLLGPERYQRAKEAEEERMRRILESVLESIEHPGTEDAERPRQPLNDDLEEYLKRYIDQTALEREFSDYAVLNENLLSLPDESYQTPDGKQHIRSIHIEVGEAELRRFTASSEDPTREHFYEQVEAGVQGEPLQHDELERIREQLKEVERMQLKALKTLESRGKMG